MTAPRTFDIRPASRWDERDVLALDVRVTYESDRGQYLIAAVKAGSCWVARLDGETVGYAVWNREFFGNPFVWLLFVHPNHRRLGAATALIREIERLCPSEKVFTSTNQSNDAMHRLLAHLGFERSGFVDNLDPGDLEIFYVKLPSPAKTLQPPHEPVSVV